jgi:hypothetical protein
MCVCVAGDRRPPNQEDSMTGREAIEKILTGKRNPMPASEIAEQAAKIATGLKGKTPKATLAALLYTEAKKDDGLVVKSGKGTFKLNPKRKTATKKPRAAA